MQLFYDLLYFFLLSIPFRQKTFVVKFAEKIATEVNEKELRESILGYKM